MRRANNDAFERHVAIAHHGTQRKREGGATAKTIAEHGKACILYLPFLL